MDSNPDETSSKKSELNDVGAVRANNDKGYQTVRGTNPFGRPLAVEMEGIGIFNRDELIDQVRLVNDTDEHLNGTARRNSSVFGELAPAKFHGIDLHGFHLDRTELVDHIGEHLKQSRILVLNSPAGSGKTSVLQLVQQTFAPFLEFKYVDCDMPGINNSLFAAFKHVGIDFQKETFPKSKLPLCIMLDEAQLTYADCGYWTDLVKYATLPRFGWLPGTCRFIISATYSLKSDIHECPVYFSCFATVTRQHFAVTDEEADQLLENLLGNPDLGLPAEVTSTETRQVIKQQAGGLIGALCLCADALQSKFSKSQPSQDAVLAYLLSAEILPCMERVFSKNHTGCDKLVYQSLKDCLIPVDMNSEECYIRLHNAGILAKSSRGCYMFSSPLAERYYVDVLVAKPPK